MDKFITIRIKKDVCELLEGLAVADNRSKPSELSWLITKEVEWRKGHSVDAIREFPVPPGANPVPLVILNDNK